MCGPAAMSTDTEELPVWFADSVRAVLWRLEGGVERAALFVGVCCKAATGLEVGGGSESWSIDLRSWLRGEDCC